MSFFKKIDIRLTNISEKNFFKKFMSNSNIEKEYQVIIQGERSLQSCIDYLDAVSELLNERELTKEEWIHYISSLEHRRPVRDRRLLVGVWQDGNQQTGTPLVTKKFIQVLSGLVKRSHFQCLKWIMYFVMDDNVPVWAKISRFTEFQDDIIQKVPNSVYNEFKSTPPYIKRTPRTPEDAKREAVGIFEPYDIEEEFYLVSSRSEQIRRDRKKASEEKKPE